MNISIYFQFCLYTTISPDKCGFRFFQCIKPARRAQNLAKSGPPFRAQAADALAIAGKAASSRRVNEVV